VTEDDDLDGQIGGVAPLQAQQLEHPDQGETDEGQSHRPKSPLEVSGRDFPVQGLLMTFSAPTRSRSTFL
jgi:hypothetical protein